MASVVALDPAGQYGLVTRLALSVLSIDDVVERVVPTEPAIQLDIARRLDRSRLRSQELRERLLDSARETLAASSRTVDESVLLGRVQRELGDWDGAVASFDEALARQPYEKQWRFELTESLVAKQDWKRAQNEIKSVLMLDNDWAPALRLRDRITAALLEADSSSSRD
ncbi:MAG: hypothetical protein R3B96_16615 [Pirellulaceae bacterium]